MSNTRSQSNVDLDLEESTIPPKVEQAFKEARDRALKDGIPVVEVHGDYLVKVLPSGIVITLKKLGEG